jgi:hypothetical protein
MMLGVSREKISDAENVRGRPMGIGFAIAWIALYGSQH